jgi:hypothetical protein
MPPWVALMAVVLAIPSFAYLLLANWEPDSSWSVPAPVQLGLGAIFALLLLWFLCFTYLRRRMGMTRLAICLVCLTAVFAIPLTLFGLLGGPRRWIMTSPLSGWRAIIGARASRSPQFR